MYFSSEKTSDSKNYGTKKGTQKNLLTPKVMITKFCNNNARIVDFLFLGLVANCRQQSLVWTLNSWSFAHFTKPLMNISGPQYFRPAIRKSWLARTSSNCTSNGLLNNSHLISNNQNKRKYIKNLLFEVEGNTYKSFYLK